MSIMKKKSNIKRYILFAICIFIIASTSLIIGGKADLIHKIWHTTPWILLAIFMILWKVAKSKNPENEKKHSVRRFK